MATLRSFCTRRVGRRDAGGVNGPDDKVDEDLFERLKDRAKAESGATTHSPFLRSVKY